MKTYMQWLSEIAGIDIDRLPHDTVRASDAEEAHEAFMKQLEGKYQSMANNAPNQTGWNEIIKLYHEYAHKAMRGEIAVESSRKLWVFDWLKDNYHEPFAR